MFSDVTNMKQYNFQYTQGWSTFIDELCIVIQEQVNRDNRVNKEDMNPYDHDETPEECLKWGNLPEPDHWYLGPLDTGLRVKNNNYKVHYRFVSSTTKDHYTINTFLRAFPGPPTPSFSQVKEPQQILQFLSTVLKQRRCA